MIRIWFCTVPVPYRPGRYGTFPRKKNPKPDLDPTSIKAARKKAYLKEWTIFSLPGSGEPLTAGITLRSTDQILTGEWQTSHCRHHSWRTGQLLTGEWQTYHCSMHHTWSTVQLLTGEWRTSHCRHHTWNIWWWYSCCSGQHTSPSEARKKTVLRLILRFNTKLVNRLSGYGIERKKQKNFHLKYFIFLKKRHLKI